MPALKHVHTYVRLKSRPNTFKCDDPYCTHFERREMVLGKASLCNDCGKEFILDREALRRVKPRCLECSDTKAGQELRNSKKVMQAAIDKLKGEPSSTIDKLNTAGFDFTDEGELKDKP